MAKTETNISTLKINRGTYAKVQENLSSITENELIITSDKNVPIPTTNDNGKAVVVNASGEYELGNAGMSQSDADARYLQLSGGTMTGILTAPVISTDGTHNLIKADGANVVTVGNNQTNNEVWLTTGANQDVFHQKGTSYKVMLDTGNTSANPTLSGGETTLSSLKLNGTNYAVGSKLYRHILSSYVSAGNQTITFTFDIINTQSTAFTDGTALVSYILGNILTTNGNRMSITGCAYDSSASTPVFYVADRMQNVVGTLRVFIGKSTGTADSNTITSFADLQDVVVPIN